VVFILNKVGFIELSTVYDKEKQIITISAFKKLNLLVIYVKMQI